MNNNSANHHPPDLVVNNVHHSPTGNTTSEVGPISQQQKRQSSLSNYMIGNKRIPNTMQTPDFQFGSSPNKNSQTSPSTPNVQSSRYNNPMVRANIRRTMGPSQGGVQGLVNMKTPTPSAYEVPSSPNINPLANMSNQNHSDSSESNPVLDQHDLHQSNDITSIPRDASTTASSAPTSATIVNQDLNDQQVQQQRAMSDEEQQLATKLKETYKNIVNFEEVVQKNCIEITIKINQITSNTNNSSLVYGNSPLINQQLSSSVNSNTSSIASNTVRTSELSNDLWTVYHHNITLLDNYYDFLVTALKPSSNKTHFKTGKNIVELYKIPRRMWVYGIVGFLEVLKNVISIFQDHEICSCFIAYCFNIISILTDPVLEMEGWWSEKLGDLSRMAIALYPSKFIDWKISAEYWYSIAMKTLYGHGKIYYHMCTVQQDNLDALVNIGKSVICRDPFVPTQHYLKLVVENICTQRNILSLLELPIIDFIKIHKVLLSIYSSNRNIEGGVSNSVESIHDSQLQYGIDLVTRYGLTFGSDSNGYNFFTRELYTPTGVTLINDPHHPYYLQQQQQQLQQQQQQQQPSATNTIEKMNFWFNKGSSFAIANINHLVGLGDAKNPFAKIFMLPEALKERKDKKDRKRKSRVSTSQMEESINGVDGQSVIALDLSVNDWFYCLQFINKSVLELSIRILNHYLIGPKQASTGHVIVWLYFLISVGEATKKFPNSKDMFGWIFKKLFPWESFINYLNSLLSFVKNSSKLSELCNHYINHYPNYIQHFNNNESLPEVWKCWGTLWFDCIEEKGDYTDVESAGVKNNNLFDMPACGTYPVVTMANESADQKSRKTMESENDERIIRIVLLARILADEYDFGLIRTPNEFKYDENVHATTDSSVVTISNNANVRQSDPYSYMEEFLLSDGRFVQNNFLQAISLDNLYGVVDGLSQTQKDTAWFGRYDHEVEDDEEEEEGYSEFEEDMSEYENNNSYHQMITDQGFYSEGDPNVDTLEGNLGEFMDTNVTYITLDTNIWLKHCGRVFKCVRSGVFKISIPLIVFQELRALRKSAEATIADAATRSVIIIRELYLSKEILPLRYDGTVASDINETTEFENNSNWRSSVDETILNSVNENDEIGKKSAKGINQKLSIYKANKDEDQLGDSVVLNSKMARMFRYCILITDDRNLRLRAKTVGLVSFQSRWFFNQLENIFSRMCID